jgi:DNA repair exonuclease SbcCD nuclease subunit
MVKLVWRTDVHMADKGPSSRKDDWPSTVLDKLSQVRRVAEKVEASAILDGGDFFHVKSPSRNSHELVRRTAEHHADYPCPVYCTPGNHDATYGDYAFLPQQPLGVLYSTGIFKRLYDEHEAVFQKDGVKVRVVGVPYHGTKYDLDRFQSIRRGDEDYLICVAHILASLKGGAMFEGEDVLRYSALLNTAPDVFLFGHWHKDQGVEVLGGKHFVNIGSLTRGSLSEDEIQRQPACAVLSFDKSGIDIKTVRLKVQAPEVVFDVEARNRSLTRQIEMDSFISTLRETLTDKAGTDLKDSLHGQDVPEKVKEKALHYLERVRG